MNQSTLCYLFQGDDVLLLHRTKKEKDINAGKWIGVGGKFLPGESPEACLAREVLEETGLTLQGFAYRGIITFCYDNRPPEYIHLFTSADFSGNLATTCDEGDLAWHNREDIPNLPLWPGDRIFLRLLFAAAPAFTLTLHYQKDRLQAAILDGRPLDLAQEDLC